ncbi:MAG: leucyl/phenylalanyl-tRNA--protein transferase [Sphingomonadaceae bacterium]|nr:leucyl/phenylalanyl-tRNA--protein transferase [Sphingomonadaceae bacterium]MCP5390949.1 leucyl/phenylalanyl-tRNA--protein transferase [Sphingomonadaceae bacterium]
MHAPAQPLIPPETLLLAYRSGIFPMADGRDDPEIFWVEPRERAIIPLDGFHCSKSLRKTIRKDRFKVTIDRAFADVIEACAGPREDAGGSWISQRIEASYRNLYDAGYAHSIECWDGGDLVGGLYGVAFDRAFCGESMFSRADNASKIALAWLVALMKRAGYCLLDCQFMTDHLASLGAIEMPQSEYLGLLAAARGEPECSLPQAYSAVVAEALGEGVGDAPSAADGPAEGVAEAAGRGVSSSPGKLIAQSFTQTS